jgi:hypothetical protein
MSALGCYYNDRIHLIHLIHVTIFKQNLQDRQADIIKSLERILSALHDPTIPASSLRTKFFYALHFSSEVVNIAVYLLPIWQAQEQIDIVRFFVG